MLYSSWNWVVSVALHPEPVQGLLEVWGRSALVLRGVGGAGEEVGLKLLISQVSVGKWHWFGELWQEWELLLLSRVRTEYVLVRSCPMPSNTLERHSRTSLFSITVATTLTKVVLLFWAIACAANSTSWPCIISVWFLPRLPSFFYSCLPTAKCI